MRACASSLIWPAAFGDRFICAYKYICMLPDSRQSFIMSYANLKVDAFQNSKIQRRDLNRSVFAKAIVEERACGVRVLLYLKFWMNLMMQLIQGRRYVYLMQVFCISIIHSAIKKRSNQPILLHLSNEIYITYGERASARRDRRASACRPEFEPRWGQNFRYPPKTIPLAVLAGAVASSSRCTGL